jgi:DNA-binding transcriptional LysR family regulator
MAAAEWLRTFVAIYRTGSVTDGAALRNVSQPAASQQLRSLERSVGAALFERTPHGVDPTRPGRELYASVADALDRLEPVLTGLDGGDGRPAPAALRLGCSPDYLAYGLVPGLGPDAPPLAVRFGTDAELASLVHHGELDVAVTTTEPGRRALATVALGVTRFALVSAPGRLAAVAPDDTDALVRVLTGGDWVAYSAELPRTRRFWQATLGRPFGATLRLSAPDLRSVAAAVAGGLGTSLLPEYACAAGLADGTLVRVWPVADIVPPEPWFAVTRQADGVRPPVAALVARLGVPEGH